MGEWSFGRAVLGMFLQMTGFFLLVAGLLEPDGSLLLGGVILFAAGFALYAHKGLTTIRYLRDWVAVLFVLAVVCVVVCFLPEAHNRLGIPNPHIVLFVSMWLVYLLPKLFRYLNQECRSSETQVKTKVKEETDAPQKPAAQADSQRQTHQPPAGGNAPAAKAAPVKEAPKPAAEQVQSAPPASVKTHKEEQTAALAESPGTTAAPAKKQTVQNLRAERYAMLDREAAGLPPCENDLYTPAGQDLLLQGMIRVLPQLQMLCAPGFAGYRLLHAADGAEAYEALKDLTVGIQELLKQCSRLQLEASLSGISHKEALIAWKASRFYGAKRDKEPGWDLFFDMLSERI